MDLIPAVIRRCICYKAAGGLYVVPYFGNRDIFGAILAGLNGIRLRHFVIANDLQHQASILS